MNPRRRPLAGGISSLLLVFALGSTSCSDEFVEAPLGLDEWDHGWLAVIEPGEQLDIGLRGNALHPDVAWQLTHHDSTVIELQDQGHETPPTADADLDDIDIGDSLLSHSLFFFTGVNPGESPVSFELIVDDRRVDIAEFTVRVVEDACASEVGAVANRCGQDFRFHPQVVNELDHGWTVALEPGDELDVTLTANALYPDSPWQVIDFDDAVIGIEELGRAEADRSPGDWGPWEPDTRHSFLPTWNFRIIGDALGESPLVLDISGDGRQVDVHELTVSVVEDACSVTSRRSTCNR